MNEIHTTQNATESEIKQLYIIGAMYLDIIKLIAAINAKKPNWNIGGFLDDRTNIHKEHQKNIIGGTEKLELLSSNPNTYFFSNMGGNWRYHRIISEKLQSINCNIATLIHPSIDINMVRIGRGSILADGCIVGSGTYIGNFVTVRLKSLISHDVKVEDYVFIGPGVNIGGGAILKKGCFIGIGATIMGNIMVGEGSTVGAGAVVTKDVEPNSVVIGIPARPMRTRE